MNAATAPVRGHTRAVPRLREETGIRFALGEGVLVLTVLSAALLDLSRGETLALLVLATLGGAHRLPVVPALVVGASAWGFWTGFAENSLGELTLAVADLLHLAGLLLVALVGSLVPGGRRG